MRTILLASCAAILLTSAGVTMAQTPAPPAETPAQAAPAEKAPAAAPAETAPAEETPAQETDRPEGPDETPSASESEAPMAPQHVAPSASESAPPPAPEVPTTRRRPPRAPLANEVPPASDVPATRRVPPRVPAGRATVDKRQACRMEARRRGLRGPDASGQMMICLAEARLACTKEAVAHTRDRIARADYIRDCLGLPQRRPR